MSVPVVEFAIKKSFKGFYLDCSASFGSVVTAIFGPSGSGKSTLLNCIAGLVTPDYGEIKVSGQRIFSSTRKVLVPPEKRDIGYVFQDGALFPHMSVGSNVKFGYRLKPEEERQVDLDDVVELFRLGPLMDRNVTTLSGGECQRVALARALATSPKLLLLDEPLASLDNKFRGVIIKYLRQIRREFGIPMLYVSHSMSEVIALADATLVLSQGKIVTYGNTAQVLLCPEVHGLSDFNALSNLLDAEVISNDRSDGLIELKIGRFFLLASGVNKPPHGKITVSIRAGDIILTSKLPKQISARNVMEARIEEIHNLVGRVLVYMDIGKRLMVEITPDALREMGLVVDQRAFVIIKASSIILLNADP